MSFQLGECVAFGVADATASADFYSHVLGWTVGKSTSNWIEMRTGSFRVYLCEDKQSAPTFELLCSDPAADVEFLLARGFEREHVETSDEIYVRDPDGHLYVLAQARR